MLKQLIDVKSNKIFVLQTAGKGTSCPACVWQTDLHTGTAAVCEPALSLLHTTAAIYLYGYNEHPATMCTFLCTKLFVVSRTQCIKSKSADEILQVVTSISFAATHL